MQLTAAAVTPPAEHAARRPAGAADAAAADAGARWARVEFGGGIEFVLELMGNAGFLCRGSGSARPGAAR